MGEAIVYEKQERMRIGMQSAVPAVMAFDIFAVMFQLEQRDREEGLLRRWAGDIPTGANAGRA